ncbi:MAG: hypothetical protein FD189_2408 [Elusimicrobia bacterium]|nr:MAG: hypothetical protein FD154_2275 [Elusimicrobiota bacterium]KAF0153183.1 MAG: hypothetical protein FD189_2408 [Elusimicrobiota bacterium]
MTAASDHLAFHEEKAANIILAKRDQNDEVLLLVGETEEEFFRSLKEEGVRHKSLTKEQLQAAGAKSFDASTYDVSRYRALNPFSPLQGKWASTVVFYSCLHKHKSKLGSL